MFLYDWYFVQDFYSDSECDELLDICKNNKSILLHDSPGPGKKVDTTVIEMEKFDNKLDRLFRMVHDINKNFFGFDLFEARPLGMNYNSYGGDLNEYPYHKDCNIPGSSCDSKLTVILNISKESFEGGDFVMFLGYDKIIPELNKRGSLFVFPSYTFHKVTPVTKGSRQTLSTWIQGPNFK